MSISATWSITLKRDEFGEYLECGPHKLERMLDFTIALDRVWRVRRVVLDPLPVHTLVMSMWCSEIEMLSTQDGIPVELFSKLVTRCQRSIFRY